MRVFIATAMSNGTLFFKTEYNRNLFKDWLKEIAGKEVRIELAKNPVSDEMRGYYFGAVLPEVRKTCDKWKDLDSDELHEIMKKQFNFFEAWNSKTNRMERFGRSAMSEKSTTQEAMNFLQDIAGYLAECGRAMPDPEVYKRFINSAPLKDETP